MQLINLYSNLPQEHSPVCTSKLTLKLWLACGAVLLVWTFHPIWQYHQAKQNLEIQQQQEIAAAQRFQIIAAHYPQANHIPLSKQVEQLAQQIAAKSQLAKMLNTEPETCQFSKYLTLLAELLPANMWLTQIEIKPEDNYFTLKGYSLTANAPAQLLENLKQSGLMLKYELHLRKLKHLPQQQNEWIFNIDSENTSQVIKEDDTEQNDSNASAKLHLPHGATQ